MPFHWTLIPAAFLAAIWLWRSFHAIHTVLSTPTLFPFDSPRRDAVPAVSVLIPARNEEKNIGICIRSLLTQIGPRDEIIVINDRSTDGTEAVLKSLGAELIGGISKGAQQLRYINLTQTDETWTGKNYALHQAIPHTRGEWLLFTDADTEHYPGGLAATVDYAEKNGIDYLTLWPQCVTKSFWEHVIQTCSLSYIGLWFPTQQINDPRSEKYFANGQYALIRRSHYLKIGGHAAVKEAFLEDFAMMKKTKETGAKGLVGIGAAIYGTHMYDGLAQIWRGWRRIYRHGFENRPFVLYCKATALFVFSVLPFIAFPFSVYLAWLNPHDYFWTATILGWTIFIILAIAWKASGVIRAKRIYSFLHALGAAVLALIFLDAVHSAATNKKTVWR